MSDFIPRHSSASRTPEHEAERLLQISADLAAFERDLGVGSANHRLAPTPQSQRVSRAHWSRTSRTFRMALTVAACLVVSMVAWMMSAERKVALVEVVVAPEVSTPPSLPQPPVIHAAVAPPAAPVVHQVVALFRGDADAEGRCPDCWCVAQWSPNWGEGRGTNDLHEDELVQASLTHACVTDPQRVVIVGLTGPATAMPKSEAEALEMSLCLLKKQSAQFPVSLVDNTSAYCLPAGVDYCMTTWDK